MPKKIFVGDNDHGDSKPASSMYSPIIADNKALREDLKDSLEAHDEMKEQIKQLRKERDEARLEVCNFDNTRFAARQEATKRGWDCYEETP